jgi:hypothetical protein
MQTAKIVAGECYAIKRGAEYERFSVTQVTTKRTTSNTTSVVIGNVVEDGGKAGVQLTLDPKDIIGPYTDVAALVEKKKREDEERKRQSDEREAKAKAERRMLYKFISMAPPKNERDYDQPFRASYGSVEISNEGKRLLLAKIAALVNAS